MAYISQLSKSELEELNSIIKKRFMNDKVIISFKQKLEDEINKLIMKDVMKYLKKNKLCNL